MKTIKAYKGFDENLQCRGFQYEVGKTYNTDEAKTCKIGFHACEKPIDVFDYYFGDGTRFCEVTLSGEIDRSDTKIAATTIKIEKELSFEEFIAIVVGMNSDSSGDHSQLASSGNGSKLSSSGYNSKLASSGYGSKLSSSGDYSQLASSGYNSKLASSGYNSKLASSGDYSKLASSGDYSELASSGYGSKLSSSGDYSVISSSGNGAMAKGVKGTWIAIAEYDGVKCVGFVTGCIGQDGLKPDTWYARRRRKRGKTKA